MLFFGFFSTAAIFLQSCHKFTKNHKKHMMTQSTDGGCIWFPDLSYYCLLCTFVSWSWLYLLLWLSFWDIMSEDLKYSATIGGAPSFANSTVIPLLWSQSFHLSLIFLCTTSSTCLILHWVDLFLRNKAWAEELKNFLLNYQPKPLNEKLVGAKAAAKEMGRTLWFRSRQEEQGRTHLYTSQQAQL